MGQYTYSPTPVNNWNPNAFSDFSQSMQFAPAPAANPNYGYAGLLSKFGPTSDFVPGEPFAPVAGVRDATQIPVSDSLGRSIGNMFSNFGDFAKDTKMIGGKDATGNTWNGWGGLALGTAQGIANLYMGMKNYGLAQDQLNYSKDAFNKNYELQKNMVNSQLEDRQNRRIAEGLMPQASTADYMTKYGVK